MFNGNKIRDLYKEKRMSLDELAEKIGMSNTGLHNALRANDFKISTLIKIAEVLNEPISTFFEGNYELTQNNENGNNYSGSKHNQKIVNGDVNIHTNTIKDKDNEIEKLRQKIDLLGDILIQKDKQIIDKEKFLEETQAFLDQVITGKEVQIARIIGEKEKQIALLERMIEMLKKQLST
jgi:transcriptional regulator with XRE-family HTH domain